MFGRHFKEFLRAWRKGDWNVSDGGIVFPKQQAFVVGIYRDFINGIPAGIVNGDPCIDTENIWVTEGLTQMLAVMFDGATQDTAHFMSLYAGAVNPQSSWNAANYPANATEITSTTDGYTQSTRAAWTPDGAAAAANSNAGSPSAFTIATTGSDLSVEGVGLHSDSARGSTSGYLVSAARYNSTRLLKNGDNYEVEYGLSLTG